MPGGKTHMAIGIGVGLGLGGLLPATLQFPWQLALTVSLSTIAALAPDLDIDDNELEELGRTEGRQAARRLRRAGRRAACVTELILGAVSGVVWLAGEIVSRLVEAVAWLIQSVTTHRGLTHSLAVTVLVTFASISLSTWLTGGNTWWGVAWSAGWASHLAADALTLSGLKLLQPWSQERFWLAPRPLRFRVGTWPDALLGSIAPIAGLLTLLVAHDVLGALADALGG